MNAKKLELIGLASLAVFGITAVGLGVAARTGAGNAFDRASGLAVTSLISSAQASPIERASPSKQQVSQAEEQAPIYLDLGAKF